MTPIWQILLLALIQGFAELLPVSSSAHVIVAEKLLGINPSAPEMTFLLVMLHTGTMFAVLLYFSKRWLKLLSADKRNAFLKHLAIATIATGVLGMILKKLIEKTIFAGAPKAEIEELFSNLPLIAFALASVGVVIFWREERNPHTKRLAPNLLS